MISKLGLLAYFSYQIKVRLHFSTAGRGKSDIEVRLVGLFFRIYLAFDYTFPPQAEGKVISKLGLLVYFSYQIKVRLHFSTADRGKSDIEIGFVGPGTRNIRENACKSSPGTRSIRKNTCKSSPGMRNIRKNTCKSSPGTRNIRKNTCKSSPGARNIRKKTCTSSPRTRTIRKNACKSSPKTRNMQKYVQ